MGRTIPGREPTLLRVVVGVAVSVVIWALLTRLLLNLAGLTPGALIFESLKFWVIATGAVAVIAALYWYLRHIATEAAIIMTGFPAIREMVMAYPPRVLFINSERDEAFGFLAGVRAATAWPESSDPKTGQRRIGGARSWLRTVARQAWEEDAQRYPWRGRHPAVWVASIAATGILVLPLLVRLNLIWLFSFVASWTLIAGLLAALTIPGPLFFAVAAPWRLAEAGVFFLRSFVRRLAGGYARRHAWRTLQEIALGISGAPHRLEEVSVALCPDPKFARGEFLYQDLAKTAEASAVAARSRSFYSQLDRVQERSDADFWRLDKWRERIATLATDPELVHTVYYKHPDALDQIANHLVRSKEELYALRKAFEQRQPAEKP